MIARLLLALLLTAFALPSAAPAACHDATRATAASHVMAMPSSAPDQHVRPAHACIGCIPPSDWLGARVTSPALSPVGELFATTHARLSSIAPPPIIPPPRHG